MNEYTNDKYYIVRADRAGVFFGHVKERKGMNEITMTDVRKLWYWDGASAVEQLSIDGVTKPHNCKFTITVDEIVIANPIQILLCTDKAVDSITKVEAWKM